MDSASQRQLGVQVPELTPPPRRQYPDRGIAYSPRDERAVSRLYAVPVRAERLGKMRGRCKTRREPEGKDVNCATAESGKESRLAAEMTRQQRDFTTRLGRLATTSSYRVALRKPGRRSL